MVALVAALLLAGAPTQEPPPPEPHADPLATRVTVEAVRERYCTRRGRTCRRPEIVLRVEAERATKLFGTLRRRSLHGSTSRGFGTLQPEVPAGRSLLRFTRNQEGRLLTPADYRLRIGANDGLSPKVNEVRFRVRPT